MIINISILVSLVKKIYEHTKFNFIISNTNTIVCHNFILQLDY